MNIGQAKEEIKRTVTAYLQKDASGEYIMDEKFLRPVLLMGAPGIGKTAIIAQIAKEMDIGLVSYTITHHTRQSAIGLPLVEHKTYGDREYAVTEYTMSEIIASVYDLIEETGKETGILFLDEINCVSETLLPTMLQFLQYKTFGTHKIPRGFVIVCAGNPVKYNRSAREFDIVTLDRLKVMNIDIDFEVFAEYANTSRIYGAILAFLDIKKDYFYRIRNEGEENYYVTARSWEDLSEMIYAYERLGYQITADMIGEYIADPEIAQDFYTYYTLYEKYRSRFAVADVLSGKLTEGTPDVREAPFDERLSLLHLLFDALGAEYYDYDLRLKGQQKERGKLLDSKAYMSDEAFEAEKERFEATEDEREEHSKRTDAMTSRVFKFLDRTFGEGQEMVMFLTMLGRDVYAKGFLADIGNDEYNKYSAVLLLNDRKAQIRDEIKAMDL